MRYPFFFYCFFFLLLIFFILFIYIIFFLFFICFECRGIQFCLFFFMLQQAGLPCGFSGSEKDYRTVYWDSDVCLFSFYNILLSSVWLRLT